MANNYVLFIHGVNTRSQKNDADYANNLIELIGQTTTIKPLVVYWGDLNEPLEKKLCDGYQKSGIWNDLWFKDIRLQQLVRFVGDAALYLSRYVGAGVVEKVAEKVAQLKDSPPEDRLHLVTHSLGTIILFDILFSSRWEQEGIKGYDSVMMIRDTIYGVTGKDPDSKRGIRLGSITTMGSPIGLFSLTDVDSPAADAQSDPSKATSTHDITPSLVQLLQSLNQELKGSKLLWRNFVHPGDPIGSPLEGILPGMVDPDDKYIELKDIPVPANFAEDLHVMRESFLNGGIGLVLDVEATLMSQTVFAILDGAKAHNSYWESSRVSGGISQLIVNSRS
jgi:hypothetical protein